MSGKRSRERKRKKKGPDNEPRVAPLYLALRALLIFVDMFF